MLLRMHKWSSEMEDIAFKTLTVNTPAGVSTMPVNNYTVTKQSLTTLKESLDSILSKYLTIQ